MTTQDWCDAVNAPYANDPTPDGRQAPSPVCPDCHGTGWVTVSDSVDYGSTTVSMESEEPCACTYAQEAQP